MMWLALKFPTAPKLPLTFILMTPISQTIINNINMPQTCSTTTPKHQHPGSPQSTGSATRGQCKRTTSTLDNEGMQRKKSKTNLGEDEPSKGGDKVKKPARKKTTR